MPCAARTWSGCASLVHPDFVLIGTRSSGPFMMHRDEWLDAIQRREVDAIELEVRDATMLDDVMIGTVHARWRLKYLGRMIEDCVLLTDVWVNDDGRWQAIRRHSTPAPAGECPESEGGIGWRRDQALRAGDDIKELTLRGIILGALITVVFTAANVYLGLKIGITFATSIPAAVISMAVLKAFRDSTIQENNIVQTIASAAGTLSAIIFVLPGLIMVGWWTGFPYWLSVAVIGIGGILGVMYSVPLRRALVTGTDLPYPEGVAAAEVLKVGAGVGGAEENRRGLVLIGGSTLVAAALFHPRQDEAADRHGGRSVPGRHRRLRHFRQPVDGVDRRRPPGRRRGRPRDGRRHADHLGVHRPALDAGRCLCGADRRRSRNAGQRRLQAEGAHGRRRHDRRRGDLDAAARSSARSSPAFARRSSPAANARPAAAPTCR